MALLAAKLYVVACQDFEGNTLKITQLLRFYEISEMKKSRAENVHATVKGFRYAH